MSPAFLKHREEEGNRAAKHFRAELHRIRADAKDELNTDAAEMTTDPMQILTPIADAMRLNAMKCKAINWLLDFMDKRKNGSGHDDMLTAKFALNNALRKASAEYIRDNRNAVKAEEIRVICELQELIDKSKEKAHYEQ